MAKSSVSINEKHFVQMYAALQRIKAYENPDRLRRTSGRDYGVSGNEAIEMAYENVLQEAKIGLRNVKRPTQPKPSPSGVSVDGLINTSGAKF